MSILSAGCVLWLERLQPLFVLLAGSAMAYQIWLVARRAPARRTRSMLVTLWSSVGLTTMMLGAWVALAMRYR